MQSKVVVITGGTSGIGAVAAETLARQGARIVLVARDRERAAASIAALKTANPGQEHRAVIGDLSVLADMKRVGAEIAAAESKVDVLINNAGAIFLERGETIDGLERTFAINHMAYFVLTNALLPALQAAQSARIVSTASDAHERGRLDFSDLQMTHGYSAFGAYGASKLCNVLFTRELARRLATSNVTANCQHPGFVATRIGANNGAIARFIIRAAAPFALSPERGAQTMIYLATSPEVANVSGLYFVRCKQHRTAIAAQDDAAAARLWVESEKIAG